MKHLFISIMCLCFCCLSNAQVTDNTPTNNHNIPTIAVNGKQYYQYSVQPKETIYGLSKRFNISQEELLAMNPFLSEGLKIGHVLTIPVREATTTDGNPQQNTQISQTESQSETAEDTQPTAPKTKLADEPDDNASATQDTDEGDFYHSDNEQIYTVTKRKERLSEIAKKFKVDIETIRQLNPRIPNSLRKGSVVILPNKEVEVLTEKVQNMQQEIDSARDSVRTLLERIQHLVAQVDTTPRNSVSTALLLPFMIGDTTGISNERYVEFYEGALMAADTLKKMGISVHIEAYDIGNTLYRTQLCLKNNDLSKHDFIIAAANTDQIPYLSEWCKEQKVKLVLPFSSRVVETENNPYIYQVNAPQNMVNEGILKLDTSKYAGKNIILIRTYNEANDEKGQLFKATRRQLIDYKIPFHEMIEYEGDDDFQDSISARMSNTKPNLVIPCASSMSEANRIISMVGAVVNFLPSAYKVEMWGYPEWVALNKSNLPVLHNLNTTIYGSYFANFNREDVRQFQINYSLNFGKDLLNTFPRYAMMAYDIMLQFSEMATYRQFNVAALQHEMHFKQTHEQSGWYNNSIYLIHYKRNQEVYSSIIQ